MSLKERVNPPQPPILREPEFKVAQNWGIEGANSAGYHLSQ